MKNILLTLVLILCFQNILSQTNTVQEFYNKAREAYKSGEHVTFYNMIVEANKLHPYHQGILYQKGIAAALINRPDESVQVLKKAILINANFDLEIKDLNSLGGRKDFEELKKLKEALKQPVITSDTAFILTDRTLHLESVASGIQPGEFYLASIYKRKVVRVDQKGNVSDFTTSAQHGMPPVLGIKVDAKQKVLWACASPMPEIPGYDSTMSSGVYQFDLRTGKLMNTFTATSDKSSFVFGDMILDNKGEVFVSDSKNNIIFKINKSSGKLEEFFSSAEFWNIQGITFSGDQQFLYIADYVKGIFRIDMRSKALSEVGFEGDLSLKGIDGLIWYNNSLVAIQNGISPMRVTRLFLKGTSDKIINHKIIDRSHPSFNEPTNGCIVGDNLYYVANSQWSAYNEQHELKPTDQLQDIVILKTDLKKSKTGLNYFFRL